MPRKPSDGAERQSINVRARTELKQRLEQIAAENGRSLAQEVDRRLEQSLEGPPQQAGDALPDIFSDEVRRYLRGQRDVARYLESLADAALNVGRAAAGRDFSETDTRVALAAAAEFVTGFHFWRGQDEQRAPSGVRWTDLPPADLGRKIAEERMLWLSAFHFPAEGALFDTLEGRIMNAYSGNGRETLSGPTPEEAEAERDRARAEAKSRGGGLVDPSEPDNFQSAEPRDEEPRRPLKDIMGR